MIQEDKDTKHKQKTCKLKHEVFDVDIDSFMANDGALKQHVCVDIIDS